MAVKDPAVSFGGRQGEDAFQVASIARIAAGGALWVFLAFAAGRVLGFATNLVLARLLSPADFGLLSFAMVTIGAFTLLQDLGVSASIVYSKRDIREVGGTALTINLLAAVLLFSVATLISPLLARFGGAEAITAIIPILALSLIVQAIGSVQNALLVKELAFRRKFLPDVVPLISSGIISILLALLGFGVWSLVFGALAKAVVSTLLLWYLSDVRPWPEFRLPVARELLLYGKHVSLASVIGFIALNVDYVIVGHTLGAFELGIYTIAFNVANLPYLILSQVITKVAFPTYSRLREDPKALAEVFGDSLNLVCCMAIPLGIAIFVGAPVLADTLGSKWTGVVEPLRILVAFGILRSIGTTFGPAYKALGRPDIEWKYLTLKLALLLPLMLWSARYGIEWVAYVHVLTSIVTLPLNMALVCQLAGISRRRLWQLMWPHLFGISAAGLVVLIASVTPLVATVSTALLGSIVVGMIALAGYVAVQVTTNPRILTLLISGARSAVARN